MNEHLARFFQHADLLLHEWKAHGEAVRALLDSQARNLEVTITSAVTSAGQRAASSLDGQVSRALSQSVDRAAEDALGQSLAQLRQEVETMARMARQASTEMQARPPSDAGESARGRGPRQGTAFFERASAAHQPLVLALVTANIMLAVLLAMSVRDCQKAGTQARQSEPTSAPGGTATQHDAAIDASTPPGQGTGPTSDAGTGSDPRASQESALCVTLAQGYEPAAARAFIAASATALCEEDTAAMVTETMASHLQPGAAEPKNQDKDRTPAKSQRSDKKRTRSKEPATGTP